MTVKITQPAINLREELAQTRKKITADDISLGAVTHDKINWWEHDLAPYFDNVYYLNGSDPSYNLIYDGGRTLYSNNGNNGPSIAGRLRGTAKGMFVMDYTLGYYWGFSEIAITVLDNWNEDTCSIKSYEPVGMPYIWLANNSSNNQNRCDYWNGYTNTSIYSNTGLNGQKFKLWRDKNNNLKVYNGSATVTIAHIVDDLVIRGGAQSPFSVSINGAMNLAKGNSA